MIILWLFPFSASSPSLLMPEEERCIPFIEVLWHIEGEIQRYPTTEAVSLAFPSQFQDKSTKEMSIGPSGHHKSIERLLLHKSTEKFNVAPRAAGSVLLACILQ